MPATMMLFFCDSLPSCDKASLQLKNHGFAEANITVEKIDTFNYDGGTFNDGGSCSDVELGGYVVIGRK